jgi:hypothetical protein
LEVLAKTAWAILAAAHAAPAAALFSRRLFFRIYGVSWEGVNGVLLRHRSALFLAIVTLCLWACFDPGARPAASAVVALSILSFLWIYVKAGMPSGPLRTIAVVDTAALAPLALVALDAWWSQAA